MAARSVRNELKRVVFLQRCLRVEICGSGVGCVCATLGVKADICEFLGQDWGNGGDEFPSNSTVASRAPNMRADDEKEENCDVAFEFEVRGGGAFPNGVPGAIEVGRGGSRGGGDRG